MRPGDRFRFSFLHSPVTCGRHGSYDSVAADGETFLFNAVDDPENISITVMVNWLTELRSGSR